MTKFLFLSPYYPNLLRRLPIMESLVMNGHRVAASCPLPQGADISQLSKLGIDFHPVDSARGRISLGSDLAYTYQILKLTRKLRPDLTHTFTIKPNTYGTLGAAFGGSGAIVNSITGLGTVFTGTHPTLKAKAVRLAAKFLYRTAISCSTKVVFQNPNDADTFNRWKLLDKSKAATILGSGVDTVRFSPPSPERKAELRSKLGIPPNKTVVILASRLIKDKGSPEFLQAAAALSEHRGGGDWLFLVVGAIDQDNPSALDQADLARYTNNQSIKMVGEQKNIEDWFCLADIACLPSYREGLPGANIEAMACGLPVVTTDVPGCRSTVQDGYNGLLAPARNSQVLADKLLILLKDRQLCKKFGQHGRGRAVSEFSIKLVIDQHLELYGSILDQNMRR